MGFWNLFHFWVPCSSGFFHRRNNTKLEEASLWVAWRVCLWIKKGEGCKKISSALGIFVGLAVILKKKTTRSGVLWSKKRKKFKIPHLKASIYGDLTYSGLKAIKKWFFNVPLLMLRKMGWPLTLSSVFNFLMNYLWVCFFSRFRLNV